MHFNWIIGIRLQYLEPFDYVNEWIVLNRTINVKLQYLVSLNYMKTND